jgi:D-glycero-D-manno-heptose 1,7-bisphosphate phosphatase
VRAARGWGGRAAIPGTDPTMPVPIFVDRDGTLIEQVEYLSRLEQVRLLPGVAAALRAANGAGHPVVVVTNQSGVARGYFSEAFVEQTAGHLRTLLAAEGARLDGHYFCPHHPDGQPPYALDCADRKPAPGMLLRAARELGLTLAGAYMIGDKASDLRTGEGLGVIPLLVRTGYGREAQRELPPDFAARGGRVFDDLPAAMAWILRQPRGG